MPLHLPRPLAAASRALSGRAGGVVSPRTLVVGLVLVAAGALFATSARTADGSDLRGDGGDLRSLVVAQQRQVAARDDRLAALRRSVDAQVAAVPDATSSGLRSASARAARAAGLDPATGAGLEVSLSDAPQGLPRNAGISADVLIVHQQDLQAVVNALWAGGATAIALQDQRLIATSAVRCVGNTLKLQGRLYAPPYTVRAIGDPASLRAALAAAPDVQAYLDDAQRVGLGWKEEAPSSLTVPGWSGSLQLVHASVLAPSTASDGASSSTSGAAGRSGSSRPSGSGSSADG